MGPLVARVQSRLPIAAWLRGYDRSWLTPDVAAGLAAGAVVVPQATHAHVETGA
jgi:MFS superfamily sulfate permease-like transporter